MTQPEIKSYAFLSDCQTSAMVSRDGSIDWYCPQRFDASSVFARMLDDNGGMWSISPYQHAHTERSYLGDSLVLQTTFHTEQGSFQLTDAMAFAHGARGHEIGMQVPHLLVRRVKGISGAVQIAMHCAPRLEYGLALPRITRNEHGIVFAGGTTELFLLSSCPLTIADSAAHATFTIQAGETVDFALAYRRFGSTTPIQPVDVGFELQNTQAAWQSWADEHQAYQGPYAQHVRRSAIVLQGLTYQPTGATVAAATTSLPERKGGKENWDYRYAWLRDLSLTVRALKVSACSSEIKRRFRWIVQALGGDAAAGRQVQIMFGVGGERDLSEHTLPHLSGYQDSKGVNIGNDAWQQKQLDVLGEVVGAVYEFRDQLEPFDAALGELVVALADQAATHWHEPDAGMWEARDRERHYLSSKVMCWVALDRAIKLAPQLGPKAQVAAWEQARDAVRQEILDKGWHASAKAFTGAFGSNHLDASVLIMPIAGFLPADDERMRATIETIAKKLAGDGLVYRWKGDANGFLLCTFWLVECFALLGERERAQRLFEQTLEYANDLGLFSEMADPSTNTQWGNTPQTFSHVGLINAAWSLSNTAQQGNE